MKIIYFLTFVALNLCDAKINIEIKTGINISDVSISYSGVDIRTVTEHEIKLFKINDNNLKNALKNHYGRKPNDVYLKSPTPWGDLYKSYGWEEVARLLTVKSAKLKSISKKPVIVMSHDFENASNNTIKVNTGIAQTVENTITTSWTQNKEIGVSQEIDYDVYVIFAKISGTTGISYTSSWGKSEEKSETETIGSTSSVETELKPGQSAIAVLSANRGYMEIEVVYKATLKGNVAINFKKPYKNHHFWGPTIGNVLKYGNMVNEVTATEVIKVGFYTDASLKVYDKVSKLPL